MCFGGSKPKTPKAEAAPMAPPVVVPIDADQDAKKAGIEERRQLLAASGRSDTVKTSGQGVLAEAATGKKKLLGA